jgi:hypothetical protein
VAQRGRVFLAGLAVTILFALPLLPEIAGARRLVFRDAHITHWPWRRIALQSLDSGEVPFVNLSASGGQPLLANPNAGLLYPTVLLEKVFAPAAAFNLHYLLHVLWAFFGARALARRLGLSPGAGFFSAIAFAFSGMMMSYASAFANSGAAAAWLPWCAAAAVDLARANGVRQAARASAAAALAFGLQLLAGEPALSLLTTLFAGFLAAAVIFSSGERSLARTATVAAGGAAAGVLAACLAAGLLLPLRAVFPLTYRGQHLYSERAFAAAPFSAWRMIEWLFPRFDGDPGALGAGAHWQYALHAGDVVYIWCVTFGVIPLLAVLVAGLSREFWRPLPIWIAAGALGSLLFAFGSVLPCYRWIYLIEPLRRFRYPIKFYLLTTACVALLSGFAAQRLRPGPARAGRRAAAALFTIAAVYGACFLICRPGGPFYAVVSPLLAGLSTPATELLPVIRETLIGDALFGLLAAAVLALVLFARRPIRGQSYLLGFSTLLLAFPWALPLFVSAKESDLARPPVLAGALKGPGRIHIGGRLPEFNVLATGTAHPGLPPRVIKLARAQIEELIPETGSPFGVLYLFDADPDGSYGYYNRLTSEALTASTPEERSRLLRAYGARWVLDEEGEEHPHLRPVTGFEVAGRRLALFELPDAVAELRWASREYRRASLSGAIELIRSDAFQPGSDVVLPGRSDRGPDGSAVAAKISAENIAPDQASATIDAAAAGHLIFGRTYFAAWKARLDGKDVPVLVANGRDLAVAVPAGRHRVDFRYDRAPFERGVLLQGAAFLVLAGVAVARRKGSLHGPGRDLSPAAR